MPASPIRPTVMPLTDKVCKSVFMTLDTGNNSCKRVLIKERTKLTGQVVRMIIFIQVRVTIESYGFVCNASRSKEVSNGLRNKKHNLPER